MIFICLVVVTVSFLFGLLFMCASSSDNIFVAFFFVVYMMKMCLKCVL